MAKFLRLFFRRLGDWGIRTALLLAIAGIVGLVFYIQQAEALNGISGRVWSLFSGDGQHTLIELPPQELLKAQIRLAFWILPFLRINEETANYTYKTHDSKYDSNLHGEFFEQITCQSDRKDSGPQGINTFGDKFPPCFIYYHCFYNTTINEQCQGEKLNYSSKVPPPGWKGLEG